MTRKRVVFTSTRDGDIELYTMNPDGSDVRRANFAPYFHPDGKRLVFASDMPDPRSRDFDPYLVNPDGSGLERVTTSPEFDGFPRAFTSTTGWRPATECGGPALDFRPDGQRGAVL